MIAHRESKFLSRILRHTPEEIGLTLGSGGWVLLDDLLRKAKKAGHAIDRDTVLTIVAESDKQRFTLSEDGRRIRAAQGHSVPVDLGLDAIRPPAVLWHGTASASLDAIFREGLKPGKRQHVHLSADPETALRVGQRHGKPVVLSVDAAALDAAGQRFWQADNGVWLSDAIEPEFLTVFS